MSQVNVFLIEDQPSINHRCFECYCRWPLTNICHPYLFHSVCSLPCSCTPSSDTSILFYFSSNPLPPTLCTFKLLPFQHPVFILLQVHFKTTHFFLTPLPHLLCFPITLKPSSYSFYEIYISYTLYSKLPPLKFSFFKFFPPQPFNSTSVPHPLKPTHLFSPLYHFPTFFFFLPQSHFHLLSTHNPFLDCLSPSLPLSQVRAQAT